MDASKRLTAEKVAAIVNGGVVVLIPCALVAASWWANRGNTAVTTRFDDVRAVATAMGFWMAGFLPLALIAAWRTDAHAQRYLKNGGGAWRGLAEAGALGFVLPVIILARAVVAPPLQAVLYVSAYGVIGLLVGITIGLVLLTVAVSVLRIATRTRRTLTSVVDERESTSGI